MYQIGNMAASLMAALQKEAREQLIAEFEGVHMGEAGGAGKGGGGGGGGGAGGIRKGEESEECADIMEEGEGVYIRPPFVSDMGTGGTVYRNVKVLPGYEKAKSEHASLMSLCGWENPNLGEVAKLAESLAH